jgi:hypothetical protein
VTIVEFLLARIAEDEEAARGSKADNARNPHMKIPASWITGVADRVLAECEAKRRIVELSATWMDQGERATGHDHATVMLKTQGITAETVLRTLVLPYADHPDFDEEWRP